MPRAPRKLLARNLLRLREGRSREEADKEIRRLRMALEQSPATVLVTGPDGTIQYVNAAFTALTGYTAQETVGMNARMLKSGMHGEAFYRDLWKTIKAGRVWRGKFHNRKKNGELFWENATIAPVFDEKGRTICYVAVKEDVTELMRTEQALKEAKNAADAANHAKSAFLANMSHEIRTPLNAVLGFIHLLQDTGLTPQQKEFLDKAGVAAEHLHGIISDILDFSKIEAGRVDLEAVPFDLRETVGNLAAILSHRAGEKGLRLSVDLDPLLPPLVLGDPLRLGQALLNLGSNAVKFTEAGLVTISARLLERGQGRVRLRIEVSDTGIGMTEEEVGGLFQPFSQADGSTTRRFGGTGLGLAISRRLMDLMEGDIEVSSRPGQGSTFALVLTLREAAPAQPARSAPARPSGARPLLGMRVLVAEDNDLNRQLAKEILRRAGAEVTLAGNGREALDRLRERTFDAVLMDLHMPDMGGLEAARQIRGNPRWARLPILALTAESVAGAREQVQAAGMDDYILKPIDPALLVRTLGGWAVEPGQRGGALAVRGVDSAAAMARLDLDPETYLTLLRRFGAGQAEHLAGLHAALARSDRPTAQSHAHSLKGAALNLGAQAIAAAARDLERVLQGEDPDAWPEPLGRLERHVRELEVGLASLPGEEPSTGAAPLDRAALAAALAALDQDLREDDARAGQNLARVAALLKGSPLLAELAPMKARIENYDYARALDLLPAFLARVEAG